MLDSMHHAKAAIHPSIVDDPRWGAIVRRDPSADGKFWFGVRTTGVYCRPSCPARRANPRNVRIFDTLEAAKASGWRACKRCSPDGLSVSQVNAILIAKACRLIEQSEAEPTLQELAHALALSPAYFHRLFKRVTGLTPKEYGAARRAERVRRNLRKTATVTEAIYAAGYQSNGRFYADARAMLGMTPTHFREGGATEEIRFAVGESSLGAILVASSANGVVAILLGDDPDGLVRDLQERFPRAALVGDDAHYAGLIARVVGFIEVPKRGLDLPLDIRGTAFQRRVWQALRALPIGETVTYAEIARRVGLPKAARAVAAACAANAIALAIPCHRVVRKEGGIGGYAWGVARKGALIERESNSRGRLRG